MFVIDYLPKCIFTHYNKKILKLLTNHYMNLSSLNSSIEEKKTRHYLTLSFTVIIFLIILATGFSFRYLNSVHKNIIQIIETQNKQIDLMHKMRSISRERIIKLQALITSRDPFEKDALIMQFQTLGGLFLETRQELLKTALIDDEKKLLKIQREIARNVVSSQYKVIEMVQNNQNQEALNYLVNETVPLQNQNLSYMDQFIVYQSHENQLLKNKSVKKLKSSYTIVAILTGLSIVLIIIVAIVVTRHMSKIVNLLSTLASQYKDTALKLTIAHDSLEHKVTEKTLELQEANEHLKHIAGHDSLTGLPNRRLFQELLRQELRRAERNKYTIALLYMDLDGFKLVNDQFGHDIGDSVLVDVTRRLQDSLRKDDLIARLGGDEFTICYSNIKDIDNVKTLCKNLIDKIDQPMFIGGNECQIGISIGVSLYPDNGPDCNTLLRVADAAMYQVKNQGKNNFQIGEVTTE